MPDRRQSPAARSRRTRGGLFSALVGSALLMALPAWAQPAGVSIRYQGDPPGVPRQDDLGVLRALGFSSVVWPEEYEAGRDDLVRMAAIADLVVEVLAPVEPLTAEAAGRPQARVHLSLATTAPDRLAAMAWRAIAHGARALVLDPGPIEGRIAEDEAGTLRPWVRPAQALARQFSANASLFEALTPGPPVSVEAGGQDVDVVLLGTPRSWVVVVTNLSGQPVRVAAALPAGVPPALWTSLIDDGGMSMMSRPVGPLWRFDIDANGVLVYLISRTPA